ncbi:MAG: hypothetical protein HN341_14260 [Verrucomicrobia bacterium]|jgi:hypothetical protein|nr:hypothetical protein [Verrucomicrobiota bacterium]
MTKKTWVTALTLAVFAVTARADKMRVDISAINTEHKLLDVKAEGAHVSAATWIQDNPEQHYLIEKNLTGEWQELTISFTAEKSGKYAIRLIGELKKDKTTKEVIPVDVLYDGMTATGVPLINGGFEDVDESRSAPKGWWGNSDWTAERYITDEAVAREGSRCIKVWHNAHMAQQFYVPKDGKNVSITLWFRAAP